MITPLPSSSALRRNGDAARPLARRDRVAVLTGAIVVGSLGTAALLLMRPGADRNAVDYESVSPVRDGTWWAAVTDAVLFGAAVVALAVATCMLVPDRGRLWATVGAALSVPAVVLFSSGVFAFGVLAWHATDDRAMSPAAGRTLLDFVEADPAHLFGPLMIGFLVLNAGLLCLAVGLWRSSTVPRVLPAVLMALVLAQFAVPSGRATDVVQSAMMLTFVAVGWLLWRDQRGGATDV
jgi:hypothetical protein